MSTLGTATAVVLMALFVLAQAALLFGVVFYSRTPALGEAVNPKSDQQSPSVSDPSLLGSGDHGRMVEQHGKGN